MGEAGQEAGMAIVTHGSPGFSQYHSCREEWKAEEERKWMGGERTVTWGVVGFGGAVSFKSVSWTKLGSPNL